MAQLLVDKNSYSNAYARLANVRSISEYSVTVDREVFNDRTHARYLFKENISDSVEFDLLKGIDSFTDKCDSEAIKNEGKLHPLCAWACAQEGDDLKQIFSGAKFAGRRGTVQSIATTIWAHNSKFEKPWNVTAVKINGVILLWEREKQDVGKKENNYSGSKFEQYMTTDKPGGVVDTDAPVDDRTAFKMMVRSDLTLDNQSIEICCSSEIDAMLGDEPIELKTRPMSNPLPDYKKLDIVIQSGLAGVNKVVIGSKTKKFVLRTVNIYQIDNLKNTLNKEDEKCLAFLFDVLHSAQNMLATKDACEISYVPANGIVKFTEFPKKEAMDELTPEFKKKFNLGD